MYDLSYLVSIDGISPSIVINIKDENLIMYKNKKIECDFVVFRIIDANNNFIDIQLYFDPIMSLFKAKINFVLNEDKIFLYKMLDSNENEIEFGSIEFKIQNIENNTLKEENDEKENYDINQNDFDRILAELSMIKSILLKVNNEQ